MLFLLTIIVLVFCVFYIYGMYVNVIKTRNKMQEASSAISVQMKKRYDLIPNILTIAQKFMEHERGLMEDITKLRNQAMSLGDSQKDMPQKLELDGKIRAGMTQLFGVFENYPQLKSDQTMITAMQTYNEVEEHIAAARRFYNSAVLELNNKVDIFPYSIVASMLNIQRQDFFQAEEKETKGINASDYLK